MLLAMNEFDPLLLMRSRNAKDVKFPASLTKINHQKNLWYKDNREDRHHFVWYVELRNLSIDFDNFVQQIILF